MGLNQKEKIARVSYEMGKTNTRIAELEVELFYTKSKLNRKDGLILIIGMALTPIAAGWDIISQFFLLQYHPGWGYAQIIGFGVGLFLIIWGLL